MPAPSQQQLLDRYGLALKIPISPDWLLDYIDDKLSLVSRHNHSIKPYSIDFFSTDLQRRAQQFGAKQPLAKAVGYQPSKPIKLIDATAGLGRDSFLLANLGCEVLMVERSTILAALLADALQRAEQQQAAWAKRVTLIHSDSTDLLAHWTEAIDTIYLDPMFPARKKSALVKKDMQILQGLLPHKEEPELLYTALASSAKRTVVKRPKHSEPLNGKQPNLQFPSKTHRFDVYLTTQNC